MLTLTDFQQACERIAPYVDVTPATVDPAIGRWTPRSLLCPFHDVRT
jgi:hypothetical protein